MPVDIAITLTVQVPQLDVLTETLLILGEKLVDYVQEIKNEMVRLTEGQAQQTAALETQLQKIVAEMEQFNAEDITETQLANLHASLKAAADTAHQLTATTQANTQKIAGIVPDAPAPPTPGA